MTERKVPHAYHFHEHQMPANAARVLRQLGRCQRVESGVCWPSRGWIADELKLTTRTVGAMLTWLEDHFYLWRVRTGRSNRYFILRTAPSQENLLATAPIEVKRLYWLYRASRNRVGPDHPLALETPLAQAYRVRDDPGILDTPSPQLTHQPDSGNVRSGRWETLGHKHEANTNPNVSHQFPIASLSAKSREPLQQGTDALGSVGHPPEVAEIRQTADAPRRGIGVADRGEETAPAVGVDADAGGVSPTPPAPAPGGRGCPPGAKSVPPPDLSPAGGFASVADPDAMKAFRALLAAGVPRPLASQCAAAGSKAVAYAIERFNAGGATKKTQFAWLRVACLGSEKNGHRSFYEADGQGQRDRAAAETKAWAEEQARAKADAKQADEHRTATEWETFGETPVGRWYAGLGESEREAHASAAATTAANKVGTPGFYRNMKRDFRSAVFRAVLTAYYESLTSSGRTEPTVFISTPSGTTQAEEAKLFA